MLYRRALFFCLLVSCLTGCVHVAKDSIPVIDHWPTIDKPRPISVTTDVSLRDADGEIDEDFASLNFDDDKARLQPEVIRAIEDSRLFSKVSLGRPGQSAFHADISLRHIFDLKLNLSAIAGFTLFVLPAYNDIPFELQATFNNPYTGKVLVIKKRGEMRKWICLFLLPWAAGHSEEDALDIIFYRMTQDALEEARSQGFFDVNEAQLEKGFF